MCFQRCRKWQSGLNETDQDLLDGMMDDLHVSEANTETAETAHILTSEQEEKQTFVITGVCC